MKNTRLLIVLFVSILFFSACSQDTNPSGKENITLTISAAASLNDVLSEIKNQFEAEHTNIELLYNFGGSGSLQQQIKQKAPVDLFFSAAEEPFRELVDKKLIDEEHFANIVKNTLVLITPNENSIDSMEALTDEAIQKIAIGTPESVPAGQYAKQTLISKQLWEDVQSKLVLAKDVRQVLTYVETGNVDAGFVYNTDVLLSEKIHVVEEIHEQNHDFIVYPAGVVSSSKNKEEAILFYQYLKTQAAQDIFKKYGFRTLE